MSKSSCTRQIFVFLSFDFRVDFVWGSFVAILLQEMGKAKEKETGKVNGPGNPSKKLQKVTKAKKSNGVITARMIIAALNRMDVERKEKEKEGHSLAKIRSYINKNHGLKMTKPRQETIKMLMRNEYNKGTIQMTNYGGKLNFTMRFQATIDDDLETASSTATDVDVDDDDEE